MRRITTIIVSVLLTFAMTVGSVSPASAAPRQRVTASITGLDHHGLGDTAVGRRAGGVLVTTTGLEASALVTCQACGPLDGATVTIVQDLGIVVVGDVLTPVVRGRTGGTASLDLGGATIERSFHGRVSASAFDATTCGSPAGCEVPLAITGRFRGGGSIELDLTAVLHVAGNTASWQSMAGSGVAELVIDVIHAG